jgi:hypothetical protein
MSASRATALLALPALALTVSLLTGCTPGTPTPATPDPDESSSSSTPTPDPTDDTEGGDGGEVDATIRANIVDAVSSGNTAALEGYFAPTVHVTYAASEDEGDVSDHGLLVMNISNATSPTAVWDFDLPASVIAAYRDSPGSAGAYIDDFPEGAIVGRSSEDKVISFVVADGLITRFLIANSEFALTYE